MADIQGLLNKYKDIPGERFFKEIFDGKEYEITLSQKADVVLDVGALAGEYSAYIYKKAGIIYALEPHIEHFAELVDNISEFGLDKVQPYNIALSDFNGEGSLEYGIRGGHMLKSGSGEGYQKIMVKTLAQFMKDEGIESIDILKIDIEDGEEAVFKSEDFASVANNIRFIIGEHLGKVDSRLKSFGFTQENHGRNVTYART